ncbi:MAG: hypothetical protein AAF657_10990 [Acidobacteriota bacterium]
MRSIKLPLWTERLLGLDPVPPPPHVFSLDARALNYGCFRSGPQGFVYEDNQSVEVPGGLFADGLLGAPIPEPERLHELVGDFARRMPEPIKNASLVVPDAWMRLIFTELAELPRKRQAREEVLRWKLKRLVPFRVEDLRISASLVTPFPTQEEPLRLLIGFAIDLLISQIEGAFTAAGIELGRVTNTTLAVAASLEHLVEADDLAGLVCVQPDAYTLSFFRRGEPLLYRYKAVAESALTSSTVRRDLRLTTSFLHQHFPETPPRRVFLAAPMEQEETWQEWLYDEFDLNPEPLAFEHFQLSRTQVGPSWLETAPLLGAATLEVA